MCIKHDKLKLIEQIRISPYTASAAITLRDFIWIGASESKMGDRSLDLPM
jgi:hypothetical protein